MRQQTIYLIIMIFLCLRLPAMAESKPCDESAAYHALDFWVGKWDVYQNTTIVGTNVIEKVLGGCAIIENWKDSDGHEGKSFFYFHRDSGLWKQVWVQDDGFCKEKILQPDTVKDGVRFQGQMRSQSGVQYLDRTTLTREQDGHVRQLIEISRDQGKTWISTFDAIYVR